MKNKNKKILMIVAVILTLVINMGAVLLPLNGLSTSEISDRFKVYFVPANYVFSIWSLIYLGLIAFAVYQAKLKKDDYKVVDKISNQFIWGSIFNSLWLFTWHYELFALTVPLMLLLLTTLLCIYNTLSTTKEADKPRYFDLLIKLPFSVYLGWISVATIANITDILYLLNFNGLGITGPVWSSIMIVIAGIVAIVMILREKDFAYSAVIIWAITGIAVKFPEEGIISTTVLSVIIAVALTALLKQFKFKR